MSFKGINPKAMAVLEQLPGLDAAAYDPYRALLKDGLTEPAYHLLVEIVEQLGLPLTIVKRSSVSPLHTDLRFAAAGAPRYKDHLLLTTWHGEDKKSGPVLWLRIDKDSIGFASGIAFTPSVRDKWRQAVGEASGEELSKILKGLEKSHRKNRFEVAGEAVQRVPAPWPPEHPRVDLLKLKSFQVRFCLKIPKKLQAAEMVNWCSEHLAELLPVHQWLVNHLIEG